VEFRLPHNLKIFLSSLLAAVVLFLAISNGIKAGNENAQSQVALQTAQNLAAGLQYFYNDQNRFPTAVEFADQNTMLNYFSVFPPASFVSSNCSQSFIYKPVNDANFQLDFCLARAAGGYSAGWNVINGQPAASK
jgi:hypothetical protein